MWYGNDFAGEPRRRKMISRRASYNGSTIAGAALGGSNELHESFDIPTACRSAIRAGRMRRCPEKTKMRSQIA